MGKNLIAVIILVILAVAALLVFRDKPSQEKEQAEEAISAVPSDQLDTIRIVRREKKDEKKVVEKIALKKKGGTWRMAEPVDYTVVENSVQRMADALADIKVVDIISKNKENHDSLQVGEETGIEVTASAGDKELARFIVGKSKGDMTFVRKTGEDAVYRIQGYHRGTFDKSVKNLRDKTVLKRDVGSVKKVTLTNEKGGLVLENSKEGEDKKLGPAGVEIENFHQSKADGMVRALVSLTAREFVDEKLQDEETGLTEGAAKVIVELDGSGEADAVTVWVGKEIEETKKTYVKTSESEQVFLVSSSTANRFKVGPDDFARTDEEMKAEEEKKKAAAANPPQMPPGMMGMGGGGMGGNQQIPPDIMRKIQAQMAKQGQGK
ncbi:MAG: DUF4340 domain-containing protein [Proteobacteria bacterium]|nr:DUF4340 domain-containing protein [Pseudomonadota bacterium]